MDLTKISFRLTGKEINYLTRLNAERYRADTVTKLMHALFNDIIPISNNNGYSKHFQSKDMLSMPDPLKDFDTIAMHSSNSINNKQKDFLTMYVEGMELVARYKKALDTIRGR